MIFKMLLGKNEIRVVLLLSKLFLLGSLNAQELRPNILFAISDDQSFPHASAYGPRFVNTPTFDRIAEEGVLFNNAYAASPGCSPSRAALLTGLYPWMIEEAGTHASSFSSKFRVYTDILEENGYWVGFTGKGWGPGDFRLEGRERNPAGAEFNELKRESTYGISDNDYVANFSKFLEQRSADAPFCFWYGGKEPHRKFKEGIGLENGGDLESVTVPTFLPDTETVRSDLLDYAFEIEYFDDQLRQMIEMLDREGLLENTIVVVTSDNGMAFPRAKANCYDYGVHVPLVISWPTRWRKGVVSEDLISLIDLAPTFLDAAGVGEEELQEMEGKSLLPYLAGEAASGPRDSVLFGRERHSSSRYSNLGYPQRGMRVKDHLLVWNLKPDRWPAGAPREILSDGSLGMEQRAYYDIDRSPTLTELWQAEGVERFFELATEKRPPFELFNVSEDPGCVDDRAGAESERLGNLRVDILRELQRTGDPRLGPDPDIWESYPRNGVMRSYPKANIDD